MLKMPKNPQTTFTRTLSTLFSLFLAHTHTHTQRRQRGLHTPDILPWHGMAWHGMAWRGAPHTRRRTRRNSLSLSLKVWHSCPFTQSKLNYQKFFLKLQLTSKALFLSVSNFLKFSLMLVRSVGFQINLKLMSQYDFNEAQQQLVFSFIPLNRL